MSGDSEKPLNAITLDTIDRLALPLYLRAASSDRSCKNHAVKKDWNGKIRDDFLGHPCHALKFVYSELFISITQLMGSWNTCMHRYYPDCGARGRSFVNQELPSSAQHQAGEQ